jgi:hypothetical protein
MSCDGRRTGQYPFSISRQAQHRLDGANQPGHACELRLGDKYRVSGEQVGATFAHQLE